MNRLYAILFVLSVPVLLQAQSFNADSAYVRDHYIKSEYQIPMRDGVKLHTIVYTPKDQSRKYPFLMQRTCYSIAPYGDEYRKVLGPSRFLMQDGYIFVYQDVRGRYMSEGVFDNMRPHIPGNNPKNKKDIDESSDTYDTIAWLLKNVKNNNGNVGQWGISYPGFYAAAALPEAHPALKASSPQAPIADFFFDDFIHHGAFLQSYLRAFPVFGVHKTENTTKAWYSHEFDRFSKFGSQHDGYEYGLRLGALKAATDSIYYENFFWQQIISHPNYDEFWQKRSIIPHLKNINHAVLTVGGWFDAEDLYGPLSIYKTIEKNSPKKNNNFLVMGPWSHGDWSRERGTQTINHIHFGDSISTFYQKEIERRFFQHYLNAGEAHKLPEAYLFDTGLMQWFKFDAWPTRNSPLSLRFAEQGKLLVSPQANETLNYTYTSDPSKPVPYRSEIDPVTFTPRAFMTDDQREASRRPDVLTFVTEPVREALLLSGEVQAELFVSLSHPTEKLLDADFVVKIIDVYPADHPGYNTTPRHVNMKGYQQLVRSEVFRGRFRNSYEKPEAFESGKEYKVTVPLQDLLHTIKPGHKLMIQIHSTWFPYIDRNPQKYVDNIFKAENSDFTPITISISGKSVVKVGM